MRNKPLSSHALVLMQFVCVALGIIPFTGQSGSAWWLLASATGVAVGLYTLVHNRLGNFAVYPEPLGHAQMITTGPYHWVRHPMYLSLLLFMLGVVMYNGGLINQVSLLGLCFAIVGKMNKEEAYLREHFDAYAAYSAGNKRLIPFLY